MRLGVEAHTDTYDIVSIRSLLDRYSAAANRLDSIAGRDAIEAVFAQTMGMFDVMNPICSGGVIAIDGDHATGHWTITELSKRSNFDKLEIFLGNYDDDLIRTPDGWRFARRVLSRRLPSRFEGMIRL